MRSTQAAVKLDWMVTALEAKPLRAAEISSTAPSQVSRNWAVASGVAMGVLVAVGVWEAVGVSLGLAAAVRSITT